MIVDMKKISILTQAKDAGSALKTLGRAGVLHIEHQQAPKSEDVSVLEEKHRAISEAIALLPDSAEQDTGIAETDFLVSEILRIFDEKETILEDVKSIGKIIGEWKEWGDFDPELIGEMENKGLSARLCKLIKTNIPELPKDVILEEISRKNKVSYCVVISRKDEPLPFKTLDLPDKSLGEMIALRDQEEERLKTVNIKLQKLAVYKNVLYSDKKRLEFLIEFNKALAGKGDFGRISCLKGYLPVHKVDFLERLAAEEKWGLLIENPAEGDKVPTLIKNPRWVEIIKPVFNIIKTLPGYKEVDISFWFLIFFSVFFGMLIGDAGYGVLFLLANIFCHVKFAKKVPDRSVFFLIYVLAGCAIIWGALTGTFFGQAWLSQRIKPLMPFLRTDKNVQAICFYIGAFHLSIAHAWKFIRKMPSLKAFSEIGWIFILWAAYFLARLLILGEIFPYQAKWLFASGSALIVLCTNPSRNIFKTIASGAGSLLMNIINSFTDIVSYIRLFAVGTATVAVADAFNQMAAGIGHGNFFAGFFTALILLLGHTLNIALGAMAILVHGVRLNVLEFSSHLNMEWSGIEYSPFRGKGD
ncbi:MAG: hypothetical protein KKH08_00095 [Candidatus Omnitrophica bacterium]|nr:hypothetical protein [Candidatus Omnitrophota bacterium]